MPGEDSALKTSSASTMPHFVSGRLAQILPSLMSLNYRQTISNKKRYHIGEIRDQPLKILTVKLEHDCKPRTLYKQVDLDGVVVFSCLCSWQK